jgi:soluble lytic murein transglycosylase-like protein
MSYRNCTPSSRNTYAHGTLRAIAGAAILAAALAAVWLRMSSLPVAGSAARPAFVDFATGVLPQAAALGSAPGRADRLLELPAGTWVSVGGHVSLPAGLTHAEALWVAVDEDDAPGKSGARRYGFLPAASVHIVAGHAPRLSLSGVEAEVLLTPELGVRLKPVGDAVGEQVGEAAGAMSVDQSVAATDTSDVVASGAAASEFAPTAAAGEFAPTAAPIPWLPQTVAQWWPQLIEAGHRHGVDPELLAIVMLVESGGSPNAHSPAGASGLMQLMPATAADIARQRGVTGFSADQVWDPALNIDFGAWYLADQLRRFGRSGDSASPGPADSAEPVNPADAASIALAAAAYNGGPGTVLRHLGGQALPAETTRYQAWVAGMWGERHLASSPSFEAWWNAGGGALVAEAER